MEEEIDIPTWNKLVRESEKAGYRDGITAGREKVFQKSFDVGYSEGFQNAFHIGKLKGALRANKLDFKFEDSDLETTRRGNCLVCINEDLKKISTDEVIKMQQKHSTEVYEKLCLKHNS